MEFLKAFEEATKLGMSKEEFLPIWELERRRRQTEGNNGAMLQNLEKSSGQSEIDGCHGSKLKCSQPANSEFKGDLQLKVQFLFNQLIEKQELQWNQLCQKCDQLQDEFCSHFDVLSNHINNTSEVQMNSLKLFLMREINLLEHDLQKAIEDKFTEQEILPPSLVTSSQKQPGSHGSNATFKTNVTLDNLLKNVSLPWQVLDKTKPRGYQEKQMQRQAQQLEPAFDVCLGDQDEKLSNKDSQHAYPGNVGQQYKVAMGETSKNLPLKSYAEVCKPSADTAALKNDIPLNINFTDTQSVGSSSKSSIEGTGFYAEVISNQMKREALITTQAKSSSKFKRSEFDFASGSNIRTTVKSKEPSSSISIDSTTVNVINLEQNLMKHKPTHSKFTIDNSDSFVTLLQVYTTPYYHIRSEACQIRFRVSFNADHQLNIFFLVSNGKFDNSAVWPILFTSSGYIYNETSQTFSPIWTLGPLRCSKPEPQKEITFKAEVILKTARYTHPNVTYKTLCDKGFATNSHLSFEWELKSA